MYGLDTISTGNVIAFAMEASERGLIKEDIKWGDPHIILDLIRKIAFREGLGDHLAEGVGKLAKDIGADFAMQIKGQEVPFHEPRGKKSVAISYATSPRGAQHMESTHEDINEGRWKDLLAELGIFGKLGRKAWEDKARFCKLNTDLASFTNSAILCAFVGFDAAFGCGYNAYPLVREALYAITGLEIGVSEMLLIGERNYSLLKIASAKQGFTRKDDALPPRFNEPLPQGNSAGERIEDSLLQESIDEYYRLRGFDRFGPTNETLRRLNMHEFINFVSREEKATGPFMDPISCEKDR
jgi:aldehyde:ferredoxin oxidoreductase